MEDVALGAASPLAAASSAGASHIHSAVRATPATRETDRREAAALLHAGICSADDRTARPARQSMRRENIGAEREGAAREAR